MLNVLQVFFELSYPYIVSASSVTSCRLHAGHYFEFYRLPVDKKNTD